MEVTLTARTLCLKWLYLKILRQIKPRPLFGGYCIQMKVIFQVQVQSEPEMSNCEKLLFLFFSQHWVVSNKKVSLVYTDSHNMWSLSVHTPGKEYRIHNTKQSDVLYVESLNFVIYEWMVGSSCKVKRASYKEMADTMTKSYLLSSDL